MQLNKEDLTFKSNQKIIITKRTLSFGNDVYQFRNITGFSDGELQLKAVIPWSIVLLALIIGPLLLAMNMRLGVLPMGGTYTLYGTTEIGWIVIICAIIATLINFSQGRKYGLVLSLNSGDKHLFVTSDRKNLAHAVTQLYQFMESEQDGIYVVNVTDNSITVKGNMTGVAAAGTADTNIKSEV
ncbi:hypothetical protein CSA56_18950 [candidate division KSB3 bacterium]|uniref:Uncharacterized protein n=1 Tax=candidate division KSB3 bacterium TaxID=2044937 RepID=A0A2G6K747_9BACT|nr:MAG: hypothetical protein CSA56_18950 [candidate division KSB3 bacterium]